MATDNLLTPNFNFRRFSSNPPNKTLANISGYVVTTIIHTGIGFGLKLFWGGGAPSSDLCLKVGHCSFVIVITRVQGMYPV